MTKDELRKYCERKCRRYSCIPDSREYQEHKLVLKLLDQEEAVLKALEDVKAKIEEYDEWMTEELSDLIDRKIAEVKGDNEND